MELLQQQNKKLLYSNVLASAIRKELFGRDPLQWEIDAQNSDQLSTSCPKYLYEDRFQIDRTKLRRMMQTSNSIQRKSEADLYFENIMKSTETHIEWPRSYKNDTRCKQHPYVRVYGMKLQDVTWAKGLVLTRLEVNNSFLRLKMAISNADHLFILGRNNNNVNRIMDDTETHIQFPDSNQMKKENQVIVYGTLDGLENARVQLRSSSPLLMSFELPMTQVIPCVDKIGAYFKVQVIFSASSKPNTSLVLIRGSVRRADKIKEATRSLLNSAFGKFANSTIVSAQLEIPPHHQESVKGEDCANIISIMEQTNTKIFFPELPSRGYRKPQVTITGTIDQVCMAREKLVDNFPIELTFDVPDENGNATEMMDLGKRAGFSITISQKERECVMSVTIKGAERLMDKIYEVHRSILKLNPIFSYDKVMPKSVYLRKDVYQREKDLVINNKLGNLMERSDLTIEESLNERSFLNEQFLAVNSPDSGISSQESFQGGSHQQNQWVIFDSQDPQHYSYSEQSDSTEQLLLSPSLANFTYQHSNTFIQPRAQFNQSYMDLLPNSYKNRHLENTLSYAQEQSQFVFPSDLMHETNDRIIFDHPDIETSYHTGIQEIQIHAEKTPYTTYHHKQLPEEISPTYHNQKYSGSSNYEHMTESDKASSTSSLVNSPLIVGSEESVAERLICIGWGSSF